MSVGVCLQRTPWRTVVNAQLFTVQVLNYKFKYARETICAQVYKLHSVFCETKSVNTDFSKQVSKLLGQFPKSKVWETFPE